jgi:hypothetical protein
MLNNNGTALAAGGAIPKRLVIWFWGNGNDADLWAPGQTGRGWTPTNNLSGLSGLENDVSVISGLTLPVRGQNNPHSEGAIAIMSGGNPVIHPSFTGSGGGASGDWNYMTVPNESIDQTAANALGGGGLRTLTTTVTTPSYTSLPGTSVYYISHNGPYNPNAPIYDLGDLWHRIFDGGVTPPPWSIGTGGGAGGGGGGMAGTGGGAMGTGGGAGGTPFKPSPKLIARRSILDAVKGDAASLRNRLGTGDKQRLDAHLSAVRDIERRVIALQDQELQAWQMMQPMEPADAGAMPPPPPPPMDPPPTFNSACQALPGPSGGSTDAQRNQIISDMVAMALACDRTRVAVMQFSQPASQKSFDAFQNDLDCGGSPKTFHEYEHCAGVDNTVRNVLKFFVDQYAATVRAFKNVPEAGGSLLDNLAVVGTSDISRGTDHQYYNYPMLIAGRAGGKLNAGLHVKKNGDNPMRAMLAVMQAVGVPITSYGTDQFATSSPLTEIML